MEAPNEGADRGGRIETDAGKVQGVGNSGEMVVIDGFCVSACTIVLSTIPLMTEYADLSRRTRKALQWKKRAACRSPFCECANGSPELRSRTDPLLHAAFQHTRGLSPTSQLSSPQGAVTNAPTRGAKWQERSSI